MSPNTASNRKRRIDIAAFIPNLLTGLNLFFGFMAILFVMEGTPNISIKFILLAVIADDLDGRLARLFNKSSEFGKEFDSLADVVSFGVASSFLAYETQLKTLGLVGGIISSSILICGAIRLARFNIIKSASDFTGLPIPAAGAFVALYTMCGISLPVWWFSTIILALSLLMVSSIKYPSFKYIRRSQHQIIIFSTLVIIILILLASSTELPPFKLAGFIPFILYIVIGPLLTRFTYPSHKAHLESERKERVCTAY